MRQNKPKTPLAIARQTLLPGRGWRTYIDQSSLADELGIHKERLGILERTTGKPLPEKYALKLESYFGLSAAWLRGKSIKNPIMWDGSPASTEKIKAHVGRQKWEEQFRGTANARGGVAMRAACIATSIVSAAMLKLNESEQAAKQRGEGDTEAAVIGCAAADDLLATVAFYLAPPGVRILQSDDARTCEAGSVFTAAFQAALRGTVKPDEQLLVTPGIQREYDEGVRKAQDLSAFPTLHSSQASEKKKVPAKKSRKKSGGS